MNAYDYTKQQWETGDKAKALRLEQLRAEKAILQSPRAAEYLRLIGWKKPAATALLAVNDEITSLLVDSAQIGAQGMEDACGING